MANIRRLAPEDAMAYRTLMLQAYAAHPEAFSSSAPERERLPISWWEQRVAPSDAAEEWVLGALDGAELVGVAGLSFHTRVKLRHKCSLFGMVVRETHRGQRLGSALVDAALTAARARPGVILVQLTVTQGNEPASRLYRRHGFTEFGIEPLAVAGPEGFVDKVHMWRALS
jgi:ribosomal protein S18 acetylase RimI-like enzyme